MAVRALNATDTMAPAHAPHNQADIGPHVTLYKEAVTQSPSTQFSPAVKRAKVAEKGCCGMEVPQQRAAVYHRESLVRGTSEVYRQSPRTRVYPPTHTQKLMHTAEANVIVHL